MSYTMLLDSACDFQNRAKKKNIVHKVKLMTDSEA